MFWVFSFKLRVFKKFSTTIVTNVTSYSGIVKGILNNFLANESWCGQERNNKWIQINYILYILQWFRMTTEMIRTKLRIVLLYISQENILCWHEIRNVCTVSSHHSVHWYLLTLQPLSIVNWKRAFLYNIRHLYYIMFWILKE